MCRVLKRPPNPLINVLKSTVKYVFYFYPTLKIKICMKLNALTKIDV